MRPIKLTLYIVAWISYVVFNITAFPELKITVMLFSIPLTMLGGWFYGYKGAFFTTLLTIPTHYFLLRYHTTSPQVLLEAFNPFGIGTQLCFSFGTAFLKTTQLHYKQLNSSLENVVKERTKSLSQLTDFLIEKKEEKTAEITTRILEEPVRQINEMLKTSTLLTSQLEKEHPEESEISAKIKTLITACITQLNELKISSPSNPYAPIQPLDSIQQLVQQFDALAGENTSVNFSGNWEPVDSGTFQWLHPIIHEAITNALRHAEPTFIMVDIKTTPSTNIISIENNGKPFSPDQTKGMGISLMRYRAEREGATLCIAMDSMKITRVECVIPHTHGK